MDVPRVLLFQFSICNGMFLHRVSSCFGCCPCDNPFLAFLFYLPIWYWIIHAYISFKHHTWPSLTHTESTSKIPRVHGRIERQYGNNLATICLATKQQRKSPPQFVLHRFTSIIHLSPWCLFRSLLVSETDGCLCKSEIN